MRSVGWQFKGTIVSVTDGDTYKILVDLGFGVFNKISIRLRGIDCPERHTPEGKIVKEKVTELLTGKSCVIVTFQDKSFDRYVADIELEGIPNLALYLITQGWGNAK